MLECQHGGVHLMAFLAVDHRDAVAFGYQCIDGERDDMHVMAMRPALFQSVCHFRLE